MSEKRKIIVLGAAGNLGMYFLDHLNTFLNSDKYEVIATGTRERYPYSFYNGAYVQLDVTNKAHFSRLPSKDVYAVVDFAGVLPAYLRDNDPQKYIDVNITGMLNILDYCVQADVDRIIYMQTWADLNGYLSEKKPLQPYWPRKPIYSGDHAVYTMSKCAAMDLIECYHHQYGIRNFIFRLPNIYLYSPEKYYYVDGKKQFISYRYLIERAMQSQDIELWGNPDCGKDIIYVKDLCQMIYSALFVDKASGIYNAGTGVKTTMREQIEGIIKVFSPADNPSSIIYCPEKRSCDDFVMDIENAKADLNYQPQYDYLGYLMDYKEEMKKNRFIKLYNE